MKLGSASGLGRHIDLTLNSNRAALVGGVAGGVAHGLYRLLAGEGIDIFGSVAAGAAVFLAWALAREIDPGNDASANLSMALAAVFAVFAPVAAVPLALVLLAVRMIIGSTGRRLASADVAVILVAAAIAGVVSGAWVVLPALAAGAWVAGRRIGARIAAAVLVTGSVAVVTLGDLALGGSVVSSLVVAALTVVPIYRLTREDRVHLDDRGHPIDRTRLLWGRTALAVVGASLALVTSGGFATGAIAAVPLIASELISRRRATSVHGWSSASVS